MTHKQIWTEIAEAFLTPRGEGTEQQWNLAKFGLCYAQGGIDSEDNLVGRFICSLNNSGGFWFPARLGFIPGHRREYDLIRGDFATLMACMTKKEFNLLVAGIPAQQKDI